MSEDSTTITFHDHAEGQEGFAVVRRFDDKVAICLSLETNGDVEALIGKAVVQKLITALQAAITDEKDMHDPRS
jgi:hypothetical protein